MNYDIIPRTSLHNGYKLFQEARVIDDFVDWGKREALRKLGQADPESQAHLVPVSRVVSCVSSCWMTRWLLRMSYKMHWAGERLHGQHLEIPFQHSMQSQRSSTK